MRSIQLREDGRFGQDDPLLWPQPVTPGNEYLACIQRRGTNSFVDFWSGNLEERDWKELVESPGVFQTSQALAKLLTQYLTHLWNRFHVAKSTFTSSTLQRLCAMEVATRASVGRLQKARVSTTVLQYLWVQTSRYALELSAFIDYNLDFRPRLTGRRYSVVDRDRIGAIVLTEEMVDEFDKMQIPVWVLREIRSLALFESKMLHSVIPITGAGLVTKISPTHGEIMLTRDVWSPEYLTTLREWSRYAPVTAPMQSSVMTTSPTARPPTPPPPTTGKRKRSHKKSTSKGKQCKYQTIYSPA